MRNNHFGWCVAIFATAVALSGCSDNNSIRSRLGLLHQGPDRFAVLPNRPIEIPEGDALPAPQPGAPALVRPDPVAEVRAVLGMGPVESATPSAIELALLERLGAAGADPTVASRLETDAATTGADDETLLVHQWLGLDDIRNRRASALDPAAETERLRAAGVIASPPAPAGDDESATSDN